MMLVSYRTRGSDAAWRAGIAHEGMAFLSSLMTLEPGDIIATGTPSGVGFKRTPPLFLQNGDITEVEIERIGQLRNPVIQGRL